jgi:hypothetical protein
MQAYLQLLRTIYQIANKDPKPLTYQCRPRELILRCLEDWNIIHENIKLLEAEGLVTTKQLDTMIICLSQKSWKPRLANLIGSLFIISKDTSLICYSPDIHFNHFLLNNFMLNY